MKKYKHMVLRDMLCFLIVYLTDNAFKTVKTNVSYILATYFLD